MSGKSVNLISFDCVETCILGYVQWRIFVIEWEWQKCKFDIYMIQLFFSKQNNEWQNCKFVRYDTVILLEKKKLNEYLHLSVN